MIFYSSLNNTKKHLNEMEAEHALLLRNMQRQQEELRVATDQIIQQKTDFLDRTQQDMGDLIEQMDEVRLELTDMRQIV